MISKLSCCLQCKGFLNRVLNILLLLLLVFSSFTKVFPASITSAATGNLTVTGQTSLGFLYVGPAEKANPTSSTLNFPLGDDRANAVTVALNAVDGSLAVTYAASTLGPTADVIFDVTGYFVNQSYGNG